jgi:Na+/H+-dicarboxylate symporter
VVPLVAVAIITGAANLGATQSAGKLGITTLGFFFGTSAAAVLIAISLGVIIKPGEGIDQSKIEMSNEFADKADVPGVVETVLGMIPENVFTALNEANIIQILVFCLFFGIALARQPLSRSRPIVEGLNTIVDAFVWMINKVMLIAPLGVFGLMADAIGTYGFSTLTVVMKLFVAFMIGILLVGFVLFPLLIKLFSDVPVGTFISAMKKPQIVALSTASSMATLPVNMEVVEQELGVSNATASFVLPLGATINMAGNAIYYALVAVFFAQFFNVELTAGSIGAIVLMSTLGAIGQAGVPGPSFLAVAVLVAAGIPIEGLPLLFALDRLFDMIRTALNITGDAACAVIVNQMTPESAAFEDVTETLPTGDT